MTDRRTSLPLLAAMVLLLTSCAGLLRQSEPPRRYHVLEAGQEDAERQPLALNAAVAVRNIDVAPPFNTQSLIYRTGATSIDRDYYNLFLAPPGELITQQVREWLGHAHLFRLVVPPTSEIEYDYLVECHVTQLYGDFIGDTDRAVVGMQFFLLRNGTSRTVLLGREYRREVPLAKNSPSGLVQALSMGLTEILHAFAADVRDLSGRGEASLPTR